MKWTTNETEIAIKLLKEKKSYDEISERLGKTSGAIRNKLQDLGYKSSDEQKLIKNCLNCFEEIHTTISNKQKFCSNSCSVTYNNKLRSENNECLNCNGEIDSWRKFCGKKCEVEYRRNEMFKAIENGDLSFSEQSYKQYLINKHGEKCMECGWCERHPITNKVPIQLEHVNGDSDDNSLKNLKLLWPNHHSLKLTYGALNKGGKESKRKNKRNQKRKMQ
jgi:hypothetical protein